MESSRKLIPVTKWPDFHPWPSLGGLRHLIFFATTNGFEKCLFRAGRRLLIDESQFFKWLDSQKEKGGVK